MTFSLKLHGFKELKGGKPGSGKRIRFSLRFDITVPAVNPNLGDLPQNYILEIEGCTTRVNKDGEIGWSPPLSRSGSYYSMNIWMSADLYTRVKRAIENSKYKDLLMEANWLRKQEIVDVSPEYPKEVAVE